MEFRKVKNKKGEVLTTQEGVELVELRLEAGDEFIPVYNSVLEKKNEVEYENDKGDMVKKTITNYSIKCRARDKNKDTVKHNDETEIFVTLTPAQAKQLQKKSEEGVELNQNVFIAYEYESKDYGKQIGVGLKRSNKPAKTFEDFENTEEPSEPEMQPWITSKLQKMT